MRAPESVWSAARRSSGPTGVRAPACAPWPSPSWRPSSRYDASALIGCGVLSCGRVALGGIDVRGEAFVVLLLGLVVEQQLLPARLLLGFVLGVSALVLLQLVVDAVELDDAVGHAVEERAVVADHEHAAGEFREVVAEPVDRVGVEVVGGLVEQQDARLGEQHAPEHQPRLLASADLGQFGVVRQVGHVEALAYVIDAGLGGPAVDRLEAFEERAVLGEDVLIPVGDALFQFAQTGLTVERPRRAPPGGSRRPTRRGPGPAGRSSRAGCSARLRPLHGRPRG